MAPARRVYIEDIIALKTQGLNQSQIAEKLGCSQAGVSVVSRANGLYWDIGGGSHDQTGEKNPNFKDGMGRSTIERLTRKVVVLAGRCLHTCERCQDETFPQEQHRHHKDRDRSNNIAENIEVLCSTCHRLEHESEMVRDAKTGQYVCKNQ